MALQIKDFLNGDYKQTAHRFRDIRDAVRDVKLKTALGKGYKTDKRKVAMNAEERRFARLDDINADEAMIGETSNILTSETLEMGMIIRRMVVQIAKSGGDNATGFFIGEDLLMTNAHVIRRAEVAIGSQVVCGNEDTFIEPNPIYFNEFRFNPERFFWKNDNLDIAIISVHDPRSRRKEEDPSVSDFGYLPLIKAQGKALHGDPLNIFHFPGSRTQRVTLHGGHLAYLSDGDKLDPFFWHTCDTQRGSSGAPVLNKEWQVVGVHSKGVPDTNKNGEVLDRNGKAITKERLMRDRSAVNWIANQGTRASRIVAAFEMAELTTSMSDIRDRVLLLWSAVNASQRGMERTIAATEKLTRK